MPESGYLEPAVPESGYLGVVATAGGLRERRPRSP
jgi:hypothetical protein